MVGAAELGASGGEATTGSNGGQTGPDGGGGVHLKGSQLAIRPRVAIGILKITYLEAQKGGSERSELDGRSQDRHHKLRNGTM